MNKLKSINERYFKNYIELNMKNIKFNVSKIDISNLKIFNLYPFFILNKKTILSLKNHKVSTSKGNAWDTYILVVSKLSNL